MRTKRLQKKPKKLRNVRRKSHNNRSMSAATISHVETIEIPDDETRMKTPHWSSIKRKINTFRQNKNKGLKRARKRLAGTGTPVTVTTKNNSSSIDVAETTAIAVSPAGRSTAADDNAPKSTAKRPPWKFRKFRDDLNSRKSILSRFPQEVPSPSQRATKKLLRSIKRRQEQNNSAKSPTERRDLKRKLNFAGPSSPKCKPSDKPQNEIKPLNTTTSSLEEGELVSEDDQREHGLDDDCICIEPPIEQIVIDDDTPSTSGPSSGYVSAIQSVKKQDNENSNHNMLTSTPCVEKKFSSAPNSPDSKSLARIGEQLFFHDVAPAAWFETITSEDNFTDYIKMSTLHETSVRKRRSARLNPSMSSADDVIVLDDTLNDSTLKPLPVKKRRSSEMVDDSVIFVSEVNPNVLPTFIPLEDDNVPNPITIAKTSSTPKRSRHSNELFTTSEKKQLDAYNDNAYNPSAGAQEKTQKRMVIIDGSNVAFNHSRNKEFSVKGLKICIDHFELKGHVVKAVVPQFRMHRSSDPEELSKLHKAGKIVITPCKNLPGKSSISYDDRFVLQLACELDAAVISNDNYRDLMDENPAFKKIIEHRVIGYTWCDDILMLPKDPYGKWGPPLHTILYRS